MCSFASNAVCEASADVYIRPYTMAPKWTASHMTITCWTAGLVVPSWFAHECMHISPAIWNPVCVVKQQVASCSLLWPPWCRQPDRLSLMVDSLTGMPHCGAWCTSLDDRWQGSSRDTHQMETPKWHRSTQHGLHSHPGHTVARSARPASNMWTMAAHQHFRR